MSLLLLLSLLSLILLSQSFWVLSHLFWFCHNLSFWVLSQFEFLIFFTVFFKSFVTIRIFKFCKIFSFWFFFYNLCFSVLSQFDLCDNWSYWVLWQFEILSFVTILVFDNIKVTFSQSPRTYQPTNQPTDNSTSRAAQGS